MVPTFLGSSEHGVAWSDVYKAESKIRANEMPVSVINHFYHCIIVNVNHCLELEWQLDG